MKFDSFNPSQKFKERKHLLNERTLEERLRSWLGEVYKAHSNPDGRIDEVMKRVELFFKYVNRDIFLENQFEEIQQALESCTSIKDRNLFINRVVEIFKPIFDFSKIFPKEFEEAQAKVGIEEEGYTELNRLVAYEKEGNTVKLHHPPARTIGPKLELYYDAMRKLVEIIKNDPEIQNVEAASWIVARVPELFARNGFTVKEAKKHISSFPISFGNEKDKYGRKVSIASISREEFLKVFGGNLSSV
ncbi:MAG: hypothetical protein WC884_01775 [Candidatus Paceibacterota bacterium]